MNQLLIEDGAALVADSEEKLCRLELGRVDDFSFFEYLSPFCFLSIEFHSDFSISYKILQYFVYYYCI